ncbi:MAG: hypothetical protein AMXMBFR82_50980 [Candidatus Hydrogenedentota bacterium]
MVIHASFLGTGCLIGYESQLMNVLTHGTPFFCSYAPVECYEGKHVIRTLGNFPEARYRYNPLTESTPEVLERIGRAWQPDILLCWMPEIHPPPRFVEESPIPTVALVSDWNVFYSILQVNLARYDVVLCDTPGTYTLESDLVSPVHLFPLYSQITPIHRPYDRPKDIDVVFVGNLNHGSHPIRARYLERLAKLSDRYRVVIATDVQGEAYGRLLSRAHIVFNHSIRGELNLRVFETMACGSLAFLEESNLEVRRWFDVDRDLVLYNTENFEVRLEHFLQHPDEARTIAERGREKVQGYAGERRFDALIDRVLELPRSGRRFRSLPATERLYQDFLMYGFSQWSVYRTMEAEMLPRLLRELPDDPRVWSSLGQHLVNPYVEAEGEEQRKSRCLKAFVQAHRLAPDSAVYALNAATVFRSWGMESQEADYLNLALLAEGMEGAPSLVGSVSSPFYIRWHRAVAEKHADAAMLRAEAHIRMAVILARRGEPVLAEEHLRKAVDLDPLNMGGHALLAEIQWAQGRRSEAVDTLQTALPDMPMDPGVRDRLCEMLVELGRKQDARVLAEETMRIFQACPEHPPE